MNNNPKRKRKSNRRISLQKIDEQTNEVIDLYREYLFSIGVRASRERAWNMLQMAHQLPYNYLITKNTDGITYQGQGVHISSKHGNQLLVMKGLGRFELKAVKSGAQGLTSTIRYKPSADLLKRIQDNVPVIQEEEQ